MFNGAVRHRLHILDVRVRFDRHCCKKEYTPSLVEGPLAESKTTPY
jgi:hypothetical protein